MDPAGALGAIPPAFRDPLLAAYREITANYANHKWEPSELNGGKFCEIVHGVLLGALTGKYPQAPTKPKNVVAACQALEQMPAGPNRVGDHSLRVLIPRALPVLYDVRNNRGVGHVGGDVDPNLMDATLVLGMASWVMAELVRVFHGVTTAAAQDLADALAERKHPLVWGVGGTRRVLDPAMSQRDQALVLLYSRTGWVAECDVAHWVGQASTAVFRRDVLKPLHRERMVEYEQGSARVCITPLGIQRAERVVEARGSGQLGKGAPKQRARSARRSAGQGRTPRRRLAQRPQR